MTKAVNVMLTWPQPGSGILRISRCLAYCGAFLDQDGSFPARLFTINALARVRLDCDLPGELEDFLAAAATFGNKGHPASCIPASFVEDPARALRAARFEQRFTSFTSARARKTDSQYPASESAGKTFAPKGFQRVSAYLRGRIWRKMPDPSG